jgi:PTS system mannose-specific IIA component
VNPVRVLVLSHGNLAPELVRAAATISGSEPSWIRSLSLAWDATFEDARQETAQVIDDLASGGELLILTDMYGGTPFNVARSFTDSPSVLVLAGVNLPMVLRLFCLGDSGFSVSELASWLAEKGRRSICQCRDEHLNGGPLTAPETVDGSDR